MLFYYNWQFAKSWFQWIYMNTRLKVMSLTTRKSYLSNRSIFVWASNTKKYTSHIKGDDKFWAWRSKKSFSVFHRGFPFTRKLQLTLVYFIQPKFKFCHKASQFLEHSQARTNVKSLLSIARSLDYCELNNQF